MHVKDHFPDAGIIAAAKDHGCDLIVMASHGRRGVAEASARQRGLESCDAQSGPGADLPLTEPARENLSCAAASLPPALFHGAARATVAGARH